MNRTARIVFFATLIIAVAGGLSFFAFRKSPQQQIIGYWMAMGPQVDTQISEVNFFPDGSCKVFNSERWLTTSKWVFNGPTKVVFSAGEYDFQFEKGDLILIDGNMIPYRFKRTGPPPKVEGL